jgi:hypothetical protein
MVSRTHASGFDATHLLLKFQGIQLHQSSLLSSGSGVCTRHGLESLKPNSIDSWEDLKRAFINNFQGSRIRAGTRHDLSHVKQEMNETLRSYTRHFFEIRATIANITDEDVIHYLQNGLFSKHTYHDFGRNRPTTAVELRDMMARWADQQDEENDHFPKCNHDKQGNGNDHFNKSQWNHLGNTKSASQIKKLWLLSAIRMARRRRTTTHNSRKSCTNNA